MNSELLSRQSTNGYTDALLDREVADFMTPGGVVISQAASVADAAKAMPEGVLSDFDLATAAGR